MKYNQLLSSVFIVLICIPLIKLGFVVSAEMTGTREKFLVTKLPELKMDQESLTEFPGLSSDFFAENFGFRHRLIQLYNAWKVELLNESSNPKVVLGKDGWLFLRDTLDHFDKQPLTKEELDQWAKTLEKQSKWVEKQGGRFLFVLTPTKATIYPAFIPDNWKSRRSSHADQIVKHLQENSSVEILDLRPVLMTHKSDGLLYDKTDTHWNDYGAAIAANAIFEALSKVEQQFESFPVNEQDFESQDNFAGDLSKLLMMTQTFKESAIRLKNQNDESWSLIETKERVLNMNGLSRPILHSTNDQKNSPSMIIFRDSFCDALIKYLAPHFTKGTYIWRNHELDTKKIASEQPDFVIQQVAERFLLRKPTFEP